MPTVTILGQEPGRQATAAGINEDGVVVGSEQGAHPFVWRPATPNATVGVLVQLKTLGEPGGKGAATAINRQGDVVGFCETADSTGVAVTRALRWPPGATEPVSLGTLLPTGVPGEFLGSSWAFGINDFGQVVGVSDSPRGSRAFIFDAAMGVMFELPGPPADLVAGRSEALAINNAAEIVGWHDVHRGARMVRVAYYWRWQGPPDLTLGQPLAGMGENDVARAINSFGLIVGDAQPGGEAGASSVAVLFRAAAEPTIVVESRFSTALGISDDGVIIGAECQEAQRAYRVVLGEFEDLSEVGDGLRIVRAVGINSRGQIAAIANDGTNDVAVLITF